MGLIWETYTFPLFRRKVTPAAEMEGQVPKAEKKRRCNEAARLKAKCKRRTYKKYVGTIQNVLLESDGYGYTNNYLYTRVEGWESLESGKLYSVKIAGYTDKHLIARLD